RRHTRFSRDWSSDVCSSDLSGACCALPGARESECRHRVCDPFGQCGPHDRSYSNKGRSSMENLIWLGIVVLIISIVLYALGAKELGRASCRERVERVAMD